MPSKHFVSGTVIDADWLNDVDAAVFEPSPLEVTTGANTFTAPQVIPVVRNTVLALGNIVDAVTIDLSLASTFTATVTGPVDVIFSNAPPAGTDQTVYLKFTNPGANLYFPAGTMFPNGTVPEFTATGKDLIGVWYDVEQVKYVVGIVWKDYK